MREGLRELGWVVNQNICFHSRYAGGTRDLSIDWLASFAKRREGQNVSVRSALATSSSRNAVRPRTPSISGSSSVRSTPQIMSDELHA